MKQKVIKIIYWSVFAVLIIAAIYMREHDAFATVRPIKDDDGYLIHQEPLCPYERVTAYIAEDGKLFIYYMDNELVNVYSVDGEFLYGIQIQDGANGAADIAYLDDCLYIMGKVSGIYVFRDTELVRFEEGSAYNDEYYELETVFTGMYDHTEGDYLFVYDGNANKISCVGNGRNEDIIQFSQEDPLFLSTMVILVIMAVIGYAVWGDRLR